MSQTGKPSTMDWGGPSYPSYEVIGMAAGASGVPGADSGAGTGAGAGAPSAAVPSAGSGTSSGGTGAQPGSPSGTPGGDLGASPAQGQGSPGTPPGTSQGNGNDGNLAVIRQSHETLQRLGGPAKVQAAIERYNSMHEQALEWAEALGYTPESFEAAFEAGPAEIHQHLLAEHRQHEAQGRGRQGEGDQSFNRELDRRLGPIEQALQRQQMERGNAVADDFFNSKFNDHALFKGKQVPGEVRQFLYDQFLEYARYDKAATKAVLKGDASGLQPHFDNTVANFIKATNAWGKFTGAPAGNGGQGAGQGAGAGTGAGTGGRPSPNPFSLNDIIEGNDNATSAMPSLRGFQR